MVFAEELVLGGGGVGKVVVRPKYGFLESSRKRWCRRRWRPCISWRGGGGVSSSSSQSQHVARRGQRHVHATATRPSSQWIFLQNRPASLRLFMGVGTSPIVRPA